MRENLKVFVGVIALVLPTAGFSDPVVPSSQPLFLAGAVKHNLILGIDDSGSMDFETLMAANDGALWLNDDGTFVKSDGTFVDGVGDKYAYLFPNGSSGSYNNGAAVGAGSHDAIPPVKAYAFARSAAYNKAYYDPSETYNPWPSYGGFTFTEYKGNAAPYDPFYTSATLNLTADFDTSDKTASQWDFDIEDDDMVCDDNGNTCNTGDKDYTYYPATYWVIDETSTYTFDPSKADGSQAFHKGNSVLLEAEDGVVSGDYVIASKDSSVYDNGLANEAGGKDYIQSPTGGTTNTPPSSSGGQVDLAFSVPAAGQYDIWIRKKMASGNSDSLWVNLYGFDSSQITLGVAGNEWSTTSDGEDWTKWWQNLSTDNSWTWDKWGTVTINSTGSQTLRIRPREVPVPIDQVLVTSASGSSPSGAIIELPDKPASTTVTRDCSTDAAPSYYEAFRTSPDAFSGVDAIGPDGRCLKKYEIKSSVSSYPGGRSYADELQNFSNWFTYYRRRHQSIRGGLGAAFQGIGGIKAGMFWINDQRDVTMYDLDKSADLKTFLDDNYKHVKSGGTPLRDALDHARTQFARTGDSAPIQYECQKNFTLLFTDGFAENETISGINNEDENADKPYADSYSSTLSDVAYKMYKDNPRSDLTPKGAVRVPSVCDSANPPKSADCNTNLHINTYTVGLGAKGTIFNESIPNSTDKYSSVQDAYDHPPTWPDVSTIRDQRQIDDLYHAAVNGRGEIFNANTPALLATELSSALRDIIASLGSASGVTFNSATLESDSLIFSALFNSTAWSGDVEARELDPSTGAITEDPAWRAADQLDAQSPSSRTILTFSNGTGDGVPFRWDGTYDLLDTGQKGDLKTSPSGSTDLLGEERLSYLRGDTSEDGKIFRNRDGLLGDIVNSTPLFVGAPRLSWPDADPFGTDAKRYTAFRGDSDNVNRTPMVYVGSNDGMLHGFKAVQDSADGGGTELLSYIPRSIFSDQQKEGLHYLTDPDYRHKYYVDLSAQAADVYMPASDGGVADWRTVLIGGLRSGGTGIFALDVTDPDNFADANAADIVLWEFTESAGTPADTSDDIPELNYQFDQPVVAMMNNGRWALLMGNGFADGNTADDEKTGLFVIYMDGGLDGTWTRGTDYKFIQVGSTGGLGGISVIDTNGDRVADRVYGGDLEGNMWVFDVLDANSSKWGSAFSTGNGANAEPAPLFVADQDLDGDGVSERQPIAMAPLILTNTESPVGSEGADGEDYLVYFGTGKYFEDSDPSDTSKQTMYGVWDRGVGSLNREKLQEQTVTTTASGDLREVSENDIDWAGVSEQQYGWFTDLPEEGERILNTPKFRGEVLFYETYTPNQSACASGGSSWFMTVSMDGSQPPFPVFDSNNDGSVNGDDEPYGGQRQDDSSTGDSGLLGTKQYYQKDNGQPGEREVDTGKDANRAGRLGWHEITDF